MNGITQRGIQAAYYARLDRESPTDYWRSIGQLVTSDQAVEKYNWLGQVPTVREWVGERAFKQLRENGMTIANKRFETSLAFSADDWRRARGKTDQIDVRVNELAETMGPRHWHSLLTNFIVAGNATTYGNAYDGTTFFSTTHSEGDSGTQKNDLTNTEVTQLNVGTPAEPTEAEAAVALLGVINYMRRIVDDQGEPMNESAMEFTVMYPGHLTALESAILNPTLLSAGGAIATNSLRSRALKLQPVMNARLSTSSNVFYVFRTDAAVKPFILQEEVAPEFNVLGEGSEHYQINDEILVTGKCLRNVGYALWQYAARATLS